MLSVIFTSIDVKIKTNISILLSISNIEMSCVVDIDDLSFDVRKKISKELEVVPRESKYGKQESIITFDSFEEEYEDVDTGESVTKYFVTIPFSYYFNSIAKILNKKFPNEDIDFPRASGYTFNGTLNIIQSEIKDETYRILNKSRSILISLACGMGKTIYSIFLCSKLQYKVCVLCHRINLIDQWEYSINKVCPDAIVQVLDSRSPINRDADFYIMNVANVTKRSREDFSNIGILVVDEAHTICTDNLSQSLFWFTPKYLVFLTATPDRTDGKSKIIDLYVGTERIERKLWRPFNAYFINTGFKPVTKQTAQGRLDWNSVLESQCLDEERNKMIVDIVRYFKTRNFLILCKRVDQGTIISRMLKSKGEDVDIFTGTSKKFNRESRILISTYSKTGVGFDHPKLDALIVASDVEEGIEQYVGRVFRRDDVVPIVFDLLDKLHTLFKHFVTRRELYTSIGGDVKDFNLYFPEFKKWRLMY